METITTALLAAAEAHQAFLLSYQAFFSGQESGDDAAIVEVHLLYYLVIAPLPIWPPTRDLTPCPSKPYSNFEHGK